MGKSLIPPGSGDGSDNGNFIEGVDLKSALEERYLAYALSTIMGRALPDFRDGLTPVHRRILHAMRVLKLDPDTGFKKCARIVGDVIGKFHPHGDQSVYDALVRLAQEFAVRYPLVDGQGNFGNIDGDNAAAMRYTEARMTEVSTLLLQGIDEDAVDFRETYDGEDQEPIVLPGAFPNLLANGSAGIAVGAMAEPIKSRGGEAGDHRVQAIDQRVLVGVDREAPGRAQRLQQVGITRTHPSHQGLGASEVTTSGPEVGEAGARCDSDGVEDEFQPGQAAGSGPVQRGVDDVAGGGVVASQDLQEGEVGVDVNPVAQNGDRIRFLLKSLALVRIIPWGIVH